MTDKLQETKERIAELAKTWTQRLGLGWWRVDFIFRDDPQTILDNFGNDRDEITLARTYVSWMYAQAKVDINLPAWSELDDEEKERAIVHELIHILVNEMREGELHHEERVVTGLTKAIFWTLADLEKDK